METEMKLTVARGEGRQGMDENMKENIVTNTLVTLHSDRWLLDLLGNHIIRYINIKSLCCTPETNIILYVNYTETKNKK